MSEPIQKERLNNSEFRDLIPHLPIADLLLIEYRKDDNNWYKLFTTSNSFKRLYGCSLCSISNSNTNNLISHMEGKKHKTNIKDVYQLYHPEYTYAKSEWKFAIGAKKQKQVGAPGCLRAKSSTSTGSTISASSAVKSNVDPKCNTLPVASNGKEASKSVVASTQKNFPTQNVSGAVPSKSKPQAITPTQLGNKDTLSTSRKLENNAAQVKSNNKTADNGKTVAATDFLGEAKKSFFDAQIVIKEEPGVIANSNQLQNDPSWNPKVNIKKLSQAIISKNSSMITTPVRNGAVVPKQSITNSVNKSDGNKIKSPSSQNVNEKYKLSKCENTSNASIATKGQVNSEHTDTNNADMSIVNVDAKQKKSQKSIVKNPFALKADIIKERVTNNACTILDNSKKTISDAINSEEPQNSEVIVIEDDLPASTCEVGSVPSLNQAIPVIEGNIPKHQRVRVRQSLGEQSVLKPVLDETSNKRILTTEDVDTNEAKKQKLVLNPAAAFLIGAASKEGEKEEEEVITPNYQTDRIITPTISNSQSHSGANISRNKPLSFSTKTFSSKPKDDDIHGLIGVEYVVKIMKSREDVSPRYECSLCELVLDGRSMQNHLVAYNHRLKFCEKHFPTALRQYQQYISSIPQHETFKVLTPILAKLAVAIEQHHGRDLPYEVLERDYNLNRHEILSKVFSCRHASEQFGPSFTHVLDTKEIDEIIAKKDNFKPQIGPSGQIFNVRPGRTNVTSRRDTRHNRGNDCIPQMRSVRTHPYVQPSQRRHSISSNFNLDYIPPVDDETHKQMVADFLRSTHEPGSENDKYNNKTGRERRSLRSRSRDRFRKRSRSRNQHRERDSRNFEISPLREGDVWQAYRHLVDQKIDDLNEVFRLYRSDPETHPMYNDEWQKFWKRRKDELILAGLDHRLYNYQPEWVRFFKIRIDELYMQAIENIKFQTRERLGLPLTNYHLLDPKYHVQVNNYASSLLPETEKGGNGSPVKDVERQPTVVAVLRLMTALEEYLGSLGPRIIDLMSKALLIEKSNPKQINEIILTLENCTLLQTAMEKLKGVVLADLLEPTKKRAFNKVIEEIENLLAFAEEYHKNKPSNPIPKGFMNISNIPYNGANSSVVPPPPVPPPAPIILPPSNNKTEPQHRHNQQAIVTKGPNVFNTGASLLQNEKKELAAKLAATLTAQGKTDFSPEQLEQLIAIYSLIERKKREAALASNTCVPLGNMASQNYSASGRKTLSDTLINFMNPSNPDTMNFNKSNAPVDETTLKQSYTVATVSRYLEFLRRTGSGDIPNIGFRSNTNQNLPNLCSTSVNTNTMSCMESSNQFSGVGSLNQSQSGMLTCGYQNLYSTGKSSSNLVAGGAHNANKNSSGGNSLGGNSFKGNSFGITSFNRNISNNTALANTNNNGRLNTNSIGMKPNHGEANNCSNRNWVTNSQHSQNKRWIRDKDNGNKQQQDKPGVAGEAATQIWLRK